ncbi:MAG: cupin domain-containing protein [Tannerellaceae bacterium]
MKEHIICKNKNQWDEVAPGVNRAIMSYNDHLMIVKVRFAEGAIGALHTHPHTQGCFVAEGQFELTIDSKKYILEKGDTFLAEPNTPHGVVCLEAGMLIDIFTPKRDDFLSPE